MSASKAVVARLMLDGTVAGIAGTRIYLVKLPQKLSAWPAIVVRPISDPQGKHLRGPDRTTRARVQVDCYSSDLVGGDQHTVVDTLADAVNEALVYEPFEAGGMLVSSAERANRYPMPEPTDERRLVRMLQDYWIWSRAA